MLAPEQLERVKRSRSAASRPTSASAPTCGSVASTTALVAYNGRGSIASGCWRDSPRCTSAAPPGFISDTLDMTTDQAERVIDDQARQFEELKPYLVARWRAARGDGAGS